MATAPTFSTDVLDGTAAITGFNTARDGSVAAGETAPTVIFTAGSSGSIVDSINFHTDGYPGDCVITIFLYDGASYWLFDEVDVGGPAAASTVTPGFFLVRDYWNLVLPTGWSIRAALTVLMVAGVMRTLVSGRDF